MKEWQRWEAMARDFASTGDHRREVECLNMALELLPPGHVDDKRRLKGWLEASARALETGRGEPGEGLSSEEAVMEAVEALEPEDAREAVLRTMRMECTSPEGIPQLTVVRRVQEETGLERELVLEAITDLVDEGGLFHHRTGNLMVDGVVEETDLETAVLGAISELSSAGRGASREDVVRSLAGRGLDRGEVVETIDGLKEAGRLEEGHPGQLRVALDIETIEEVHHEVVATVEEMDPEGGGVLSTRIARVLADRGWELGEVEEAMEELVDSGELLRDGGEVRLAPSPMDRRDARETLLELIGALSADAHAPVPTIKLLRGARRRGLTAVRAQRILDEMVDSGLLWRDARGVRMQPPVALGDGAHREVILTAVRQLQHHQQGASRLEVIDRAMDKGLEEWQAREALEDLIDDGLIHDTGGGFLRPG